MIPAKLAEILDELSLYSDRAERIQALIDLSDNYSHPTFEELPRLANAKIPGCESEVYISVDEQSNGTQSYRFAVDNPQGISAKAMAVILSALSGTPKVEVRNISENLAAQVFGSELSMGKNLGLTNMVKSVKSAANR